MRLFLCQARERKRSIVNLCEHFVIRSAVQKELIRTLPTKKSSMMRLFLCQARERKRNRRCGARAEGVYSFCRAARRKSLQSRINIVNLCEHFVIRSAVQKELIRTIFYSCPPIKEAIVFGISVWSRHSKNLFSPTPFTNSGVYMPV